MAGVIALDVLERQEQQAAAAADADDDETMCETHDGADARPSETDGNLPSAGALQQVVRTRKR